MSSQLLRFAAPPHCWHATGKSQSDSWSGANEMLCCWCGAVGWQKFETKRKSLPMHGPKFQQLLYEQEETVTDAPDCNCVQAP